eukprot:945163_1
MVYFNYIHATQSSLKGIQSHTKLKYYLHEGLTHINGTRTHATTMDFIDLTVHCTDLTVHYATPMNSLYKRKHNEHWYHTSSHRNRALSQATLMDFIEHIPSSYISNFS